MLFLYVVINQLIGDIGFRLSREAIEFIQEWGYWFNQYPKTTYFRLFSFDGHLFKLTIFCGDRWILMEFSRQVVEVNVVFSSQHKTVAHYFLLKLELYSCSSLVMDKSAMEEFHALNL